MVTGNPPTVGAATPALADPERALAVAYAPARVRPALAMLFALDERLGTIVGTTTEPMIGLMRLAWWREAVERLDHAEPPAEPLLMRAAGLLLPLGIEGAALAEIEHGWSALIDGDLDREAIARFGRCRGGVLFSLAGRLLGAADSRLMASGEGWALADLAHRHSVPEVRAEAKRQATAALSARGGGAWPRAARPLAALAALAAWDAGGVGPRRQGSPTRLARMLAVRLTGR